MIDVTICEMSKSVEVKRMRRYCGAGLILVSFLLFFTGCSDKRGEKAKRAPDAVPEAAPAADAVPGFDNSDIAGMTASQVKAEMTALESKIKELAKQSAILNVQASKIRKDPEVRVDSPGQLKLKAEFNVLREEYQARLDSLPGVAALNDEIAGLTADRDKLKKRDFELNASINRDRPANFQNDPRVVELRKVRTESGDLLTRIREINRRIEAIRKDAWENDPVIKEKKRILIEKQYQMAALDNQSSGMDNVVKQRNELNRKALLYSERMKLLARRLSELDESGADAGDQG